MRILHVVKTSDGAQWAARQARVLGDLGVEVHVAVPAVAGRAMGDWQAAGAQLHVADLSLPVRAPHRLGAALQRARRLVAEVNPDLIHSHFVTTTCLLRLALGKDHPTPRLFQVAGPLHLEHWWPRRFELSLAGPPDYWIGSSRCIQQWYRHSGVPEERLFLSYYGFETEAAPPPGGSHVRRAVGAQAGQVLVGNISWMYPPKRLLGQTVGLKCHEDIIEALGQVCRRRPEVLGVFVGGGWNRAAAYERKLKQLAAAVAGKRIRFVPPLPSLSARAAWAELDLAVHVPLSENCGGVIEPLHAGVPVVASRVGGIPEVVLHERTGWLVPPRSPERLAETIEQALAQPVRGARLAALGKTLVDTMFNVERTAREVFEIYRHLLEGLPVRPAPFDSARFVAACSEARPSGVQVLSH